ncbi:MAG: hypothetical protein HC801_11555 [Nitrospira sp.]|nr:hypothetical protein [Nitrospira sp.]
MKSPPVLQAFVLAERIYTDAATGQRIICGTFNQIMATKFPRTTEKLTYAFILLCEVTQRMPFQLRFVSLKDNRIVMQSGIIQVEAKDPCMPVDLVIEIPPLPLAEPGVYSFECWANEHMVGSVRLPVSRVETES